MTSTEPTFERERPSGLTRFFFKLPTVLYRDGLAELMRRRCIMLLTTRGRRSGQPRTNGVSFMPLDGNFIAFSGYGIHSHWYRNLLAHPEVTLQVGRRRIEATAVPVAEPERRRTLMLQMQARSARCGPPKPVRGLMRRLGVFDYEGDIELAVAQAEALPVVELIPRAGEPAAAPSGGAR